jgi:Mg2+/citrate symporter
MKMLGYYNNTTKFSTRIALIIGITIAIIGIVIYIYWAFFIYRYSSDRVGKYLLTKFKLKHPTDENYKETDTQYITYDVAIVNTEKTIASTNILVKDKISQVVLASVPFSININTECKLFDTCISL